MRLLNVDTLKLEEFFGDALDSKSYAILSHTWDDDEVNFADLRDPVSAKSKKGYQKIKFTCDQAVADSLKYVWIDTCCIGKSLM